MNTYKFEVIDGELFINLHCDLDIALMIERHNSWEFSEPVNTDDSFTYHVQGPLTKSVLCLINYGFEELE